MSQHVGVGLDEAAQTIDVQIQVESGTQLTVSLNRGGAQKLVELLQKYIGKLDELTGNMVN